MIPSSNSELRVFISSTFRDLQEEREHLVKKIFPEIRALCRQRGITFTEVDLRWGLTDEDQVLGQVIRTCLEEIDKCRPYFIGITGERYGYVPELLEYYKDAELLERWPWIEEAAMEGASIIDLEFRHAVLNDPVSVQNAPRFYFRRQRRGLDDGGGDLPEGKPLDGLKERVRAAGLHVEEFRDPGSLGEMVYDELIEIIRRDFADARRPTPLEEERSKHIAFAASRRRAYIPNHDYLRRLNDWFASDDTPLILYAESGSGKSSLVSFWCEQLRRRQPELPIVEHYVGIGAGDSDHLGIIRHVMEEIKERFERAEELPTKPEAMERDFANWLGFTVGKPLLLVIDGINQLTGRALQLHWLPPMIPPGVKLIISSTVEQTLVDLRARGWAELGMQPLKEREREAVVVRFLAEYRKALSAQQVKRIAEDAKCSHPLFLRTLLEELRLHGRHENLGQAVTTLLATTGTEDLFQRVLERLEDDYSQKTVREVLAFLWCSRGGLTEEELAELTGIGRLNLSTLLLGLDYHLVRRDGVLTFFHDYLRRAVEKRYLRQSSMRADRYGQLAEYFERTEVTLRSTLELLHALETLGDRRGLDGVLSRIDRFTGLWKSDEHEVLRLWSTRDLSEMAEAYGAGLEQWEEGERTDEERIAVLDAVGTLYERVGAWRDAEQVARRRLERARAVEDRTGEAAALATLGMLARQLGRREEAEDLVRQAERIARELGDLRGIARAVGNRGIVHSDRGEYEEALACFAEQEQIARALGDRREIAGVTHNIGLIQQDQGSPAEAIERFRRALEINRSISNRQGMGYNFGAMGSAHSMLGRYNQALACYAEQEEIARELGDRRGIAAAAGNRGIVHRMLGEYGEALACYVEQEAISQELGDRRSIANAVGNRGSVQYELGEYGEALACYAEQEAIARELGDRAGISGAVGNRGSVYHNRGEYGEALACYAEQEAIAREVGDRRSIAVAVGNRGTVHRSRGEYSEALACFRTAATEHREVGFLTGLTYWLEGTADVLLEIVGGGDPEIPAYLAEYVHGAGRGTWVAMSLRSAREHAEECVAISDQLSKQDTLFGGRILLARIDAAEGAADAALHRLGVMVSETTDDAQRAELHYWLWKLGVDPSIDHRSEADRLYTALVERIPKHDYRVTLEELRAAKPTPSTEADDAAAE